LYRDYILREIQIIEELDLCAFTGNLIENKAVINNYLSSSVSLLILAAA